MDRRLRRDVAAISPGLPDLPSVSADEFRRTAAALVAGVAVVTTHARGLARGCTVSAVTSLSLNPPLMLVCLDLTSRTLPHLNDAAYFAINVLADDEEGRRCARLFASKAESKFDDIPSRVGITGAPLLECVHARFECVLQTSFNAGDHVIVAGRVVSASVEPRDPLVYYQGKFRRLAPE